MANIKTYARIKPSCNLYKEYETTEDAVIIKTVDSGNGWNFSQAKIYTQNSFAFSHVFPHSSPQEEIFETAAKGIVEAFLKGYNGTIFAYGQTGSGKTYTMEGSARQYRDRGLAPRAISMIYNALALDKESDNSVHMSYLEIYQEVGYDLLNPAARHTSTVTPFPKVVVLDGLGGACLVKNLSSHLAASEAVAQSLLLQGQANRKVAETPMNQRSSRSHAVLTLQLTSKKKGSDIMTRSKLHLVDLAGSERVAKTKTDGVQLTEAKYINLSLHHLEGVIIALQHEAGNKGKSIGPWTKHKHYKSYSPYNMQWNKPSTSTFAMNRRPSSGSDIYLTSKHIPYRNSLLTMVLKDSLGGNCMTAMIATLTLEYSNIGETLSTCRFAQRVACITNQIRRNEEIDDKALIRQLQRRIGGLEAELALLKFSQVSHSEVSPEVNSKLTDEDKIFCNDLMKEFVAGKVRNPLSQGVSKPHLLFQCLKILRNLIVNHVCQTSQRDMQSLRSKSENVSIIRPSASADDLKKISRKEEQVASSKHRASSSDGTRRKSAPIHVVINLDTYQDRPLSGTSIKSKYKSPFEKKREKEIEKLNDRIEKALNQQVTEENKMKDWKEQIKQEQLEILYKEISYKADVMRDNLASQHAVVLKLKQEGANSDRIEQEKHVEKQLRKWQEKIERRLEHIKQKMGTDKLCEESSKERPVEVKRRPKSVEEKFSNLKKPDGSLNTRQVLEKLQKEERKQLLKDSKLEKQRINTVAEELELREAATRLKLREFKEKLRQLREARELEQSVPKLEKGDLGIHTFENFSLINSNATDAMKTKVLENNLEQTSVPIKDKRPEESGISAFRPYKKGGKIVPRPGVIQLSSQSGNDAIGTNLEVVDLETSAQAPQGCSSGAVPQSSPVCAFQISFKIFGQKNLEEDSGGKPAVLNNSVMCNQKEIYPFIRAAIHDYESGICENSNARSNQEKLQQSNPTVLKPPLPDRFEMMTKKGWISGPPKDTDRITEKWLSGYSPSSSRPSTGVERPSSSSPLKHSQGKFVPDKWNSGYTSPLSRPSTSGSERTKDTVFAEKFISVSTNFQSTCSSDPSEGSPEITLKELQGHQNLSFAKRGSGTKFQADILRIDSSTPKDFVQNNDSGCISMETTLLNRSNSFDGSQLVYDPDIVNQKPKSGSLKEKLKTDTAHCQLDKQDKSSCSKKKSRKQSKCERNSRSEAEDSKRMPKEDSDMEKQRNLYRPSEVYTNQNFDVHRMGLKNKEFDDELQRMLNGFTLMKKKTDSSSFEKSDFGLFDHLKTSLGTDDLDNPNYKIQALRDDERELRYLEKARQEKERIARIRRVRNAAEVIQKYWRRHQDRKVEILSH